MIDLYNDLCELVVVRARYMYHKHNLQFTITVPMKLEEFVERYVKTESTI